MSCLSAVVEKNYPKGEDEHAIIDAVAKSNHHAGWLTPRCDNIVRYFGKGFDESSGYDLKDRRVWARFNLQKIVAMPHEGSSGSPFGDAADAATCI